MSLEVIELGAEAPDEHADGKPQGADYDKADGRQDVVGEDEVHYEESGQYHRQQEHGEHCNGCKSHDGGPFGWGYGGASIVRSLL